MKQKIFSIVFVLILGGFMLTSIVLPDLEVSISERRTLQQFPEFDFEDLMDGKYFSKLNDYFVEQFPLRDTFRKIKGFVATNIFQKSENNGVFIKDDYMYQLDEVIDQKSVDHILDLILKIKDTYILSDNVYYGIIPDKNYYLEDTSIPKLDYQKLEDQFSERLHGFKYIDLFDTLSLEAYYSTDIHWRQEYLQGVVNQMMEVMGGESITLPTQSHTFNQFYGALYGRMASSLPADQLTYLTNEVIEDATVYNYEKNAYFKVYEESHLEHIDPYDVYLSGASAILVIENEHQNNGKELVIFRDSFGSSVTPLLIENYEKITMIDLRYVASDFLKDIDCVSFNENQDVLFLYSTPIINQSGTLR